jgi:hypothetical protein
MASATLGKRREEARSSRPRRMLPILSRALLALFAALWALAGHVPQAQADVARYGANLARVGASVVAAGWPERQSTWCGIAATTAIVNYRAGFANVTQQAVARVLDNPFSASPWGTPSYQPALGPGPGSRADISRDIGTDPRALAFGQADFVRSPYANVVARRGAYDATRHLIADLLSSREPIQALVLHGAHSVLVSGVIATDDPVADPSSILDLEVWDPGYGLLGQNIQFAQMEIVPLNVWLSSRAYWGAPYAENRQGHVLDDPDPAVGPYAYDPKHGQTAHLWVGHYVYIRPEASDAPAAQVSPDWALDPSGAVIAGAHGELPPGYSGPAVTLAGGEPILPPTQVGPHASARESAGVPWWLALGALPLLAGGLLMFAAVRNQLRLRQVIARAGVRPATRPSPLWTDTPEQTVPPTGDSLS